MQAHKVNLDHKDQEERMVLQARLDRPDQVDLKDLKENKAHLEPKETEANLDKMVSLDNQDLKVKMKTLDGNSLSHTT